MSERGTTKQVECTIDGEDFTEWTNLSEALLVDSRGRAYPFTGFLLQTGKTTDECIRAAIPPGWMLLIGRKR